MKNYLELNNQLMQKKEGFYQLEKDREAIAVFLDSVEKQRLPEFTGHGQRMKWLIEEGYYVDFLASYTESFIVSLTESVIDVGFSFASYMAVSKFYTGYALKTNDKKWYLESYEERIVAVALFLGQGDERSAMSLAMNMIHQCYQPATPTFLNAGKKRGGEMVSCFLLSMDDSLNAIYQTVSTCAQLSKIGGGVAVNVSELRARNESIKGIQGAASGVMPVLKLLEDTFSYVNQLGQRPGAGVAYLNIFHSDVEEFLETKKINASEKSRLQTLSIGLIVPDKFMELAKSGSEYYVFGPKSVKDELGLTLDELDFSTYYDVLVENPRIEKRVLNPRKLMIQIAKMQFESGYPYMVFKDVANDAHALKELGQIRMSNLCTEIFQLQETSIITDYGKPDIIGMDVSCNLGSLNIVNVMEQSAMRESVRVAMDALTVVSDMSHIQNAPGAWKANESLHAVGLGAMNLHGFFAKNCIAYESEEAKQFVSQFFMMMNYYSIERSMEIARERGQSFVGFHRSEYANGNYFSKYETTSYHAVIPRVKELFKGMYVPTCEDWKRLAEDVAKYGLYHGYRLAIAPTQSIGYVQNATPGIAPVTDIIERRTYGDSTTYYPMPYLTPSNVLLYKSAFHMDMMKVIDLVAEIQPHIDQGISTTLFVDSQTTTKELARYYIYAHKKGLKALYYTRTKNLAFEECVTCSV